MWALMCLGGKELMRIELMSMIREPLWNTALPMSQSAEQTETKEKSGGCMYSPLTWCDRQTSLKEARWRKLLFERKKSVLNQILAKKIFKHPLPLPFLHSLSSYPTPKAPWREYIQNLIILLEQKSHAKQKERGSARKRTRVQIILRLGIIYRPKSKKRTGPTWDHIKTSCLEKFPDS